MYGPPGCGKTSFVKAIAGQIGYNIYEMQLSSLKDDTLNQLMSSISRKAILLFEDADAVFGHEFKMRKGVMKMMDFQEN